MCKFSFSSWLLRHISLQPFILSLCGLYSCQDYWKSYSSPQIQSPFLYCFPCCSWYEIKEAICVWKWRILYNFRLLSFLHQLIPWNSQRLPFWNDKYYLKLKEKTIQRNKATQFILSILTVNEQFSYKLSTCKSVLPLTHFLFIRLFENWSSFSSNSYLICTWNTSFVP